MTESWHAVYLGTKQTANQQKWRDRFIRFFSFYGLLVPVARGVSEICAKAAFKNPVDNGAWTDEFIKSIEETESEHSKKTAASHNRI